MSHHSKILIGVLTLFLMVAAAGGGYLFYNYQESQRELLKVKQGPQAAARQEIKEVSAKIGELMDLPKNEEPTLATVTDVNKLKGQQFFAKAVNGDKVLIYTNSSKAILYRPGDNKIIEVASVNLGQNQQQAPSETPRVKVALYNGSSVRGAASNAQKTISQKITNVDVVEQTNAKKNDYEKTLIVDLSGKQKEAADQLSKVLGAAVGPMPAGETKPQNADLLVILGK